MSKMPESRGQEQHGHHHEGYAVMKDGFSGGPLGLGDPDDMTLRKVELEVMIPQKMKEKAKKEKCASEVKDFADCAMGRVLSLPFKCRSQAQSLKECLMAAYEDQSFKDECTQQYLQQRSDYRRTGIREKHKKKENVM